jgi:hypothetical protein
MTYVRGGISVAGALPNGVEVRVSPAEEYVQEDVQTTKEVCKDEYDYATGETEYKCRMQPTTEKRSVTKKYFRVVGGGLNSRHQFVEGAFATATGVGIHRWRTLR